MSENTPIPIKVVATTGGFRTFVAFLAAMFSFVLVFLIGVVAGISAYGNCIGIPDVGGEVCFSESYSGNPLVNAMCVGLLEKDSMVRAPSDMIALGDAHLVWTPAAFMGALYGEAHAIENFSGMGLLDINSRYGVQRPSWPGSEGIIDATAQRHRNRYTISFCDGHIESVRNKALFQQKEDALKRWNNDNASHAEFLVHKVQ